MAVSDNFSGTLSNWTFVNDTTWATAGGLLTASGVSGQIGAMYWSTVSFNKDQSSSITAKNTSLYFGLGGRLKNHGAGTVDGYGYFNNGSVQAITNGSGSTLFSTSGINTNDIGKIDCTGTTIGAYLNGSLQSSISDSTWDGTSSAPGCVSFGNGATWNADDWNGTGDVSGTAYTYAPIATQAQVAILVRQTQANRLATQRQAALLSAIKTALKTLLAVQAQAGRLTRQVGKALMGAQAQASTQAKQTAVARLAGQAQAALLAASRTTLKALLATQATTATLSSIKTLLRTLLAAQASAATMVRQAGKALPLGQAQASRQAKATSTTRVATQAQAASQSKLVGKILLAVQRAVAVLAAFIPGAPTPRQIYLVASDDTQRHLTASQSTYNLIASEKTD